MIWNSVSDNLRNISLSIDNIVYWLMSILYDLFFNLSKLEFLSSDTIKAFSTRIYILVGLIMLFKIAISLLTWMADPDKVADKKTGGAQLVQRIMVSLILISLTPFLFSEMYSLQNLIMEKEIIPKLVLGVPSSETVTSETSEGDKMAMTIYAGTYELDRSYVSLKDMFAGVSGTINERDKDKEYTHDYKMILSWLIAIAVDYVLFGFCFDIVIRALKLSLLQIIAPIPILSYMVGKDELLTKWASMCGKVFVDLFMRLAIIYFGIYIIYNLQWPTTGVWYSELFYRSITIVAIYGFLREIPNFVSDLFGIKMDGHDFGLGVSSFLTTGTIAAGKLGGRMMKAALDNANARDMHGLDKLKYVAKAGAASVGAGFGLAGQKGSFFEKMHATRQVADKYAKEEVEHQQAVASRINDKNKSVEDLVDKDESVMRLTNEKNAAISRGDSKQADNLDKMIKQAKDYTRKTGHSIKLKSVQKGLNGNISNVTNESSASGTIVNNNKKVDQQIQNPAELKVNLPPVKPVEQQASNKTPVIPDARDIIGHSLDNPATNAQQTSTTENKQADTKQASSNDKNDSKREETYEGFVFDIDEDGNYQSSDAPTDPAELAKYQAKVNTILSAKEELAKVVNKQRIYNRSNFDMDDSKNFMIGVNSAAAETKYAFEDDKQTHS